MSDQSTPDEQPILPIEPLPPADPPIPAEPVKGGASWKAWAAAGAAAGLVVVGGILLTRDKGGDDTGAVNASASQGQDGQRTFAVRGAQGEITAIDGDMITLASTGRDGTTSAVTVKTDGDTTFTDVVDGTASDVKKGDNVLVRGEVTDGKVTAESLTDNGDQELGGPGGGTFRSGATPPEGFTPPDGGSLPDGATPPQGFTPPDGRDGQVRVGGFTVGKVTKVDGDQITVEDLQGDTVVVTITSDTDVKVTKEVSLHDLKKGDTVRAEGERDGDTVTATAVRRGDEGFFLGGGPGGFQRQANGDATTSASASAS